MRSRSLKVIALPLLLSLASGAWAEGRQAIIIANRSYEDLANVSGAASALALSQDLRAADFQVSTFSNLDARAMRRAVAVIEDVIETADELLVLVSGQITRSSGNDWLLATNATTRAGLMPGDDALSLEALAQAMSASGASAVLLAGDAQLRGMDVPQGVAVFSGETTSLVALVRNGLLVEGRTLLDVAARAGRGVAVGGYLPKGRAFLSAGTGGTSLPDGVSERDIENLLFARAKAANSEAALSAFLERYPSGANAAIARDLLSDLTKTPTERARDEETELHLTRTEKRAIQADLTMLGFDTNGVDGLFGRGTRSAIRRWQAANGLDTTGYLNQSQVTSLQDMAIDVRLEQERSDAAYWRQTGRTGTSEGYTAYLNRYPNGIFAEIAKQELADLQNAAEARAWAETRQVNTETAYRDFLTAYPQGVYAAEAQARLEAFAPTGPTQAQIDEAQSQESKAMANAIFRVLAEQRLAALGFNPGALDGRFDEATRAAIARYQEANELTVTGYLDVKSINRLLNN